MFYTFLLPSFHAARNTLRSLVAMASISDSPFFPPLDKILSGDQLLISWRTAFYALLDCGDSADVKTPALEQFFSDPTVLDLLAHPFKAFSGPSPQTKSAFETKTSAINVTPSLNTRYDIKVVKEDSLWLSREAKIDEVSALRIVVGECQDRPSAQLLGQLSNEELTSIQEAAGRNQASTALLSRHADSEAIQASFDSQGSRRLRILRSYLSERRNLLQCLNIVCQKAFYPGPDGIGTGKGKTPEVPVSWVGDIGKIVGQKIGYQDEWIVAAIAAIGINAENIGGGSGWFQADGGRQDIETEWVNNQIMEISHTMEIMFQIIDIQPNLCSSTIVLAWLELGERYKFFDQFATDDPSTETLFLPLKSAVSLISLAILSPGPCLEYLRTTSSDPRVTSNPPLNAPYILSLKTIAKIHEVAMRISEEMFVNAAPMVLAWADILQTLSLRVANKVGPNFHEDFDNPISASDALSPPKDAYHDVMAEILRESPDDVIDVIQYLASSAVDRGQVFQNLSDLALRLGGTSNSYFSAIIGARMRLTILGLIRSSSAVGYIPEVVEASLSALTGGQNYWDILDARQLNMDDDPLTQFLMDPDLVDLLLESAKHRYPYESALLKMTRSLATCYSPSGASVVHWVGTINTFTCTLPDSFAGYTTTQEEENNNSIRLTAPLHLFDDQAQMSGLQGSSKSVLIRMDEDFVIPGGTYGRMIMEAPKVSFWDHSYSGLKYFGKVLETFLTAGDLFDGTTGRIADRDSVADIIGTFAGLLLGNMKAASTASFDSATNLKDDAHLLLETASSGLGRNRDIITVIFDIFEEELQRQSTSFGSDVSLDVIISCVQFIHGLLTILPGRVWPLLGRSGLLELGRGGGRLSSIVGSVELVSGRFDLLLACTRLFEGLVDDFVSNAVQRRSGVKSSTRFGNEESTGTGVPDQIISKALLSFTRYFVDVLESSCTWKFAQHDHRRRLNKTLTQTFHRILRYAYSIDSQSQPAEMEPKPRDKVLFQSITSTQLKLDADNKPKPRIMGPLLPAASHLVDSFLSASSGTLRFQPLLETLDDGFHSPPSTIFINTSTLCVDQVNATLLFSATLLRVGVLLGRPQSQLESQLFKVSPLISRLYAVNRAYRLSVLALFEALIVSASKGAGEPPSLVGYLGTRTSKNFLHILFDLDKPLSRQDLVAAIWHFLAMVVSNRQQWFANYLLTGKSSKNALKNKAGEKDLAILDRPPLVTALDALSNIGNLPKLEALAMFDFVALAQNFWPWATYDSAKHAVFIKSISEHIGQLKPIQASSKLDDAVDACHQTKIAAYIAEILAMHLFHSRQTGHKISPKDLLPNLSYFTRFAVGVPLYKSSLHGNLKRNFETRYSGCTILDFERTSLEQRPLGREYFYNVPIMNKSLSYNPTWKRLDGFGTEVANANVNLSLVDAQIALLHGWSFLAIELSSNLSNQPDLQKVLAKVSMDCLISNKRSQGLEDIFKRLNQRRGELALILVQRLIEANTDRKEMEGLLVVVWEAMQQSESSFEHALVAGDAEYYRTLLKLLFLALRVHAEIPLGRNVEGFKSSSRLRESSSVISMVLEILKCVVADGIRDLASFIHDKPADAIPEDIALVTGILQACLRIPGIEFCYTQIVHMFSANDTIRVATTLFSWSDNLSIDGDPVYGELSVLFLLEMSTMPPMAEQLAIDGVLGQIGAANITTYLRRGNVSPFADSAGIQRCYNIWVRGILPLLLNILDAVGDSIGVEVALFINQFPNLLKQSSEAFDTPETSRTITKGSTKHISLSTCSEVHTLSLIVYILSGFRLAGTGTMEIPEIKWDPSNVLENVEFWLGARAILRERILAMGERVAMTRQRNDNSGFSTMLEEKILGELLGIRDVLSEMQA